MLEIKDFADRQEGERVEFSVRSSALYLAWRLLLPFLLLVLGFVLAVAIPVLVTLKPIVTVLVAFLLLGLPLLWLAWRFLLWYYDYFIITNLRILDFEKIPFFYEKLNEARLNRIQDVRVAFPNALTNILNIGHVYVQTAGMAGQLAFRFASKPNAVQARLLDVVAQGQSPRARAEPSGQPVTAMRRSGRPVTAMGRSVGPSPLGTSTSGSAPATKNPGEQTKLPQPRKRTAHDLIFYSPVAGTNQTTWHKHWWVLLKSIFLPALLAVLLLGAFFLLPKFVPGSIALLITAMLFLGNLLYLGYKIIDWYNDVYIITDDRIVDIEKTPLVSEDRREARLAMVQDVSYVQPNLTSRLLGFGDVIIETAAKTGAFTFNNVPNPQAVQREVFARWEATRHSSSA